MILGDLFQAKMQHDPGVITAQLTLNATHSIFTGHFPGQPVVPGVCMMLLIRELLESALDQPLRLIGADHAKFLTMLRPGDTVEAELRYTMAENTGAPEIKVTARLFNQAATYFKYQATFTHQL
jgi:3-hydroxyacyl-[acyl-carrier-protein] dehydratase